MADWKDWYGRRIRTIGSIVLLAKSPMARNGANVVIAIVFAWLSTGYATAATRTWSGAGGSVGNHKFSFPDNWSGSVAPAQAGDSLLFDGSFSASHTPTLDKPGNYYTFTGLTFASGGFRIGGNGFRLEGGSNIVNNTWNWQTIDCPITFVGTGNITVSNGYLTFNNTITTGAGMSLVIDGWGGVYSIYGQIVGDGGLVMQGSQWLYLNGNNSYRGGTLIRNGWLQIGDDHALGDSAGNLTLNGGVLDLHGYSPTVGRLSGDSSATILTVSGVSTLTANSDFDSAFAGVIDDGTGKVAFTKGGTGTLTVKGTFDYSGETTIKAGVLALDATGQIENSPIINESVFEVLGGNHTIVSIAGGGTSKVLSGSLTARSITQDSLIIGGEANGAAHAVPEPAVICLMAAGLFWLMLGKMARRKRT